MERYVLEGTEADLKPLIELARKLKIKVTRPEETVAERGLRTSLTEVKAIRQGRLKGIPARDLVAKLRKTSSLPTPENPLVEIAEAFFSKATVRSTEDFDPYDQ